MGQLEHSSRLDPGGAGGDETVERWYDAAAAALAAGRLDEAADLARRCLAAPGGQSDPRCATLAGQVAAEEGDFDEAAAHFRRALTLAPDDVTIARELAEALEAGGRLREAQAVLEEVTRRAPDDAALLVDLSFVRLLTGDGAGARDAIGRAARLRPDDEQIVLAQARIQEALGEGALAAAASAQVIATTTSPAVLTDLARLLLDAGQFGEADRAFKRLQVVDPDHYVVAQHGRIWCQIKTGDWRGALELAIGAAQADRYELTTALLAYAKDRLFTRVPDDEAAAREAEMEARFLSALREHAELHRGEGAEASERPNGSGEEDRRG